jgi:hypothetical protein
VGDAVSPAARAAAPRKASSTLGPITHPGENPLTPEDLLLL